MHSIIYVGIGGFIGAVFRFLLSNTLQGTSRFPFGTLGVNIIGAFTLSLLTYSSEQAFSLPMYFKEVLHYFSFLTLFDWTQLLGLFVYIIDNNEKDQFLF